MFDFSRYEKQKAERARVLSLHQFSLRDDDLRRSADQIDWELQDRHIRAIVKDS